MPTQPDNDWIPEDELAKHFGLTREKIRAERPPAAEVKKKSNVISWAWTAAARLAVKLKIPMLEKNAAPPPASTEPPAPPTPEDEELTVWSSPAGPALPHFPQPWLIKAKRADGEIVVVRVLDSRKYMPKLRNGEPMKFRAKKAAPGNWWQLTQREPRFPGAW